MLIGGGATGTIRPSTIAKDARPAVLKTVRLASMTVRGGPLEREILQVQDLAVVASGADAETWPDIAQTYQGPIRAHVAWGMRTGARD